MPICIYIDCKERATHNYKDEKERLYCKNHKKILLILLSNVQNNPF